LYILFRARWECAQHPVRARVRLDIMAGAARASGKDTALMIAVPSIITMTLLYHPASKSL